MHAHRLQLHQRPHNHPPHRHLRLRCCALKPTRVTISLTACATTAAREPSTRIASMAATVPTAGRATSYRLRFPARCLHRRFRRGCTVLKTPPALTSRTVTATTVGRAQSFSTARMEATARTADRATRSRLLRRPHHRRLFRRRQRRCKQQQRARVRPATADGPPARLLLARATMCCVRHLEC